MHLFKQLLVIMEFYDINFAYDISLKWDELLYFNNLTYLSFGCLIQT